MASSIVNFCPKTRTVQQPQPDGPNPNTAESLVKNAHRTGSSLHLLLQQQSGSVCLNTFSVLTSQKETIGKKVGAGN
jgi:hypothetical protein